MQAIPRQSHAIRFNRNDMQRDYPRPRLFFQRERCLRRHDRTRLCWCTHSIGNFEVGASESLNKHELIPRNGRSPMATVYK